jgi:hypothetical protein
MADFVSKPINKQALAQTLARYAEAAPNVRGSLSNRASAF